MPGKFTLGKKERLKSRKRIDQLFSEGKTMSAGQLKLFYQVAGSGLQFAAGVSSKNFRKAVDRNRVKRLLRECWRVQKILLKEKLKEHSKGLDIFIIYTGKQLPEYKDIYEQTGKLLDKLIKLSD